MFQATNGITELNRTNLLGMNISASLHQGPSTPGFATRTRASPGKPKEQKGPKNTRATPPNMKILSHTLAGLFLAPTPVPGTTPAATAPRAPRHKQRPGQGDPHVTQGQDHSKAKPQEGQGQGPGPTSRHQTNPHTCKFSNTDTYSVSDILA